MSVQEVKGGLSGHSLASQTHPKGRVWLHSHISDIGNPMAPIKANQNVIKATPKRLLCDKKNGHSKTTGINN